MTAKVCRCAPWPATLGACPYLPPVATPLIPFFYTDIQILASDSNLESSIIVFIVYSMFCFLSESTLASRYVSISYQPCHKTSLQLYWFVIDALLNWSLTEDSLCLMTSTFI